MYILAFGMLFAVAVWVTLGMLIGYSAAKSGGWTDACLGAFVGAVVGFPLAYLMYACDVREVCNCSECESVIPATAKACRHCGARLAPPAPPKL